MRAFFSSLDSKHVAPLAAVRTHHVSAYVEVLGRRYRAPTVKQHLAAIRMLFDWLIVGQSLSGPNPAAVRGPKHVVKRDKTPVFDGDEAKKLIDSIDVSTIVGLRDRAMIALLVYTFARANATLALSPWPPPFRADICCPPDMCPDSALRRCRQSCPVG